MTPGFWDGCLENDDLENDDLENNDLENDDLENYDLENDDLKKTAGSGGRLIEVCEIPHPRTKQKYHIHSKSQCNLIKLNVPTPTQIAHSR